MVEHSYLSNKHSEKMEWSARENFLCIIKLYCHGAQTYTKHNQLIYFTNIPLLKEVHTKLLHKYRLFHVNT